MTCIFITFNCYRLMTCYVVPMSSNKVVLGMDCLAVGVLVSQVQIDIFRYGDQIVAIKVLHRGSTVEERTALESRFAREVNMMSRVKHDNLVKVSALVFMCLYISSFLESIFLLYMPD